MTDPRSLVRSILAVALITAGACSPSTESGTAPATPAMPPHWVLVADVNVAPDDIQPISARLGGEIIALRNTEFSVSGNTLMLSTIVAASQRDADAIESALLGLRPEEWIFRRGEILYEFAGPDETLLEMREGRLLLTTQ